MLYTEVTRPSDISSSSREDMFQIMDCYYQNMKREKFESDLKEKTHVVFLKNRENTIVGFTTLLLWDINVEGVAIKGLYSGDTIVEKMYWGQTQLQSALGRLMIQVCREHSDTPVYWLLSSKGYKTYCMLPLYFLHFYPTYNEKTPCFEKKVIDMYGALKFGDAYNPITGIAVNNGEKDLLREGVAEPAENKLSNEHVRFFLQKNFGYRNGDELVCVARIAQNNVRSVVRRFEQHG